MLKDPIRANLDRGQIVKGWIDADGTPREAIHDAAWAGADRKQPPVGSIANIAGASSANTIGDSELIAVGTDPDFVPGLKAFRQALVQEIPTPRGMARDARFCGTTPARMFA